MALLTFSTPVEKETPISVLLDKEALLALTAGDAHWSVGSNVTRVILHYLSIEGSQTKILTFDFASAAPSASVTFSATARDDFNLHLVTLMDHDGGTFLLGREDADLTSFDISF